MLTEKQEETILLMEMMEDECYIDPNEEIEHPPVAISYKEHSYKTGDGFKSYPTPIGTYGNFSFIYSAPKHKKTFLVRSDHYRCLEWTVAVTGLTDLEARTLKKG